MHTSYTNQIAPSMFNAIHRITRSSSQALTQAKRPQTFEQENRLTQKVG